MNETRWIIVGNWLWRKAWPNGGMLPICMFNIEVNKKHIAGIADALNACIAKNMVGL